MEWEPSKFLIILENNRVRWDEHEKEAHINYLELLAIFVALQSFENEIKNTHVQILADNTTAIAYVNHMGGKQGELDDLA